MRLRLLGLLALAACTRDVYVPLEVVAPTGSGTLHLEVVITPEGSCGSTRPATTGTRFDEGETPELALERGSTALWVGAWEGDTCGAPDTACYAGCTVVDVRRGVDAQVALASTDCANVCGSTSDAGLDAGLEDAGPVDAPPVDAPFDVPVDVPVDVPTDAPDGGLPSECDTGYVEVAAGYDHTCARSENGEVYCWGANTHGQCGVAVSATARPTSPVALTGRAVQIGAGHEFSCARLDDGRVACWGNDGGEQDRNGNGTRNDSSSEPTFVRNSVGTLLMGATDLAVGYWHACALTTGGRVSCWGQNASNELGTGVDCNAGSCAQVDGFHEVVGLTATGVAAGVGSSCARLASGNVQCWGYNAASQLSVGGGASAVPSPRAVLLVSDTEVSGVLGVASGGTQSFGTEVAGSTAALRATTCGFDATGVTCWGANDQRQGLDSSAPMIRATRTAAPLGITALSVGDAHVCAIHGSRLLSCWGDDSDGQLGDGTPSGLGGGPTDELVDLPHGVCSVAASERHTCAALTDGMVYCWGSNASGRLGDSGGDTATPRAIPLPRP